jgi:outer membrane lipoprotein carrier protein
VAVTIFSAAPGIAGDVTAVLADLERAGRSLSTMQAKFVETRTLVLLDENELSEGRVILEVPGRLRWDYLQPQESVMLIKDGRFARYFPRTKQVFRGEARGEADLLVGFGPGAAGLGERYDVTLVGEKTLSERAAHVLDLVPKAGDGLFSAIRMWVDAELYFPLQTRLTEPTGDYTTIRFEEVSINQGLPKGAFDLKLPGDVIEIQ